MSGGATRVRHVNLVTQQRRLRHVRGIAARNLDLGHVQKITGEPIPNIKNFFTLHLDDSSPAFYTSERIQGSQNPTWKSLELGRLRDSVNTSASHLIIKVWSEVKDVTLHLVLEWKVHLSGLVYLGDQLHSESQSYPVNSLVFGMFDGYYGAPSGTEEPELDISQCSLEVENNVCRTSYNTSSLSRIQMVLRAITQTQASVKRVRSNIEDKLLLSQANEEKTANRELYLLKVHQLRSDLEWRTMHLQSLKEQYEQRQSTNHQRDVAVRNKNESLQRDKDRLHDKKKAYFDTRESFLKLNAQLAVRRKQLVSELAFIYPIIETPNVGYTICGVKLPHSENFAGQDEMMVSVALGYSAHMVQMIAEFIDTPLRYAIEHRVSRSRIRDHIIDKLLDKDRDFPLYSKGKDKFQFNYGVFLLNKDIAQLRYACGLSTPDLRTTLPNIKSLLEYRLGVKFEQNPMLRSGQMDRSLTITTSSSQSSAGAPSPHYQSDKLTEEAIFVNKGLSNSSGSPGLDSPIKPIVISSNDKYNVNNSNATCGESSPLERSEVNSESNLIGSGGSYGQNASLKDIKLGESANSSSEILRTDPSNEIQGHGSHDPVSTNQDNGDNQNSKNNSKQKQENSTLSSESLTSNAVKNEHAKNKDAPLTERFHSIEGKEIPTNCDRSSSSSFEDLGYRTDALTSNIASFKLDKSAINTVHLENNSTNDNVGIEESINS